MRMSGLDMVRECVEGGVMLAVLNARQVEREEEGGAKAT